MTSHTITIDGDTCSILDPDLRNLDVMKFSQFNDVSFHEIIENLHVLDLHAPVISHVHFVCRKNGRHMKKLKTTEIITW